jgi:glutathione S-transferase
MAIKLYDSAFSPFARKVRMVLEHKGLAFEAVDGLLKSNHAALEAVNGRVEVPALTDGDVTVVNSADIVAYLEFRYPETPVYPAEPATRVAARAWERTADTLVDAVLVNLSYWKLLDRDDTMPAGLLDKARADMALVYTALERALSGASSSAARCRLPISPCFPTLPLRASWRWSSPRRRTRTSRAGSPPFASCPFASTTSAAPATTSAPSKSTTSSASASSGAAIASSGCSPAASTTGSSRR